jgi:hypothetical protein
MPPILASALETLAWDDVVERLMDADRLRAGLEAARTEYDAANGRRQSQLDALDANVARLRARLDRVLDEQLDAAAGSETARALREKARQIEDMIGRQLADRARLESKPGTGLSADQAASLLKFSEEIRDGLDVASAPDETGAAHRRRIFKMLRLRGTVRPDQEHGALVGRKHRVTVEWDAAVQLRGIGCEMTNIQTVVVSASSGPSAPPNPAADETKGILMVVRTTRSRGMTPTSTFVGPDGTGTEVPGRPVGMLRR